MKNQEAFSLIELSIVLIIIGLLVAGIIGGKSLIDSAKERALINEMTGYKQAFSIFIAAKGRRPGDLDDDGWMGRCLEETDCVVQTFTTSDFPSPYNTASSTPNEYSAPFVEMYLEGIIDFRPNPLGIKSPGVGTPHSKIHKQVFYYFLQTIPGKVIQPLTFKFQDVSLYFNNIEDIPMITFKRIDEKIDDGDYKDGNVRASCYLSGYGYYNTYDTCIEYGPQQSIKNSSFIYKVNL